MSFSYDCTSLVQGKDQALYFPFEAVGAFADTNIDTEYHLEGKWANNPNWLNGTDMDCGTASDGHYAGFGFANTLYIHKYNLDDLDKSGPAGSGTTTGTPETTEFPTDATPLGGVPFTIYRVTDINEAVSSAVTELTITDAVNGTGTARKARICWKS